MTDFKKKYSPVGRKLFANIMLWVIFMMTFLLYYILKHDLTPTQNVPLTDIYGLINWSSFFILTISSIILFTIFSFVTHKSNKEHDKINGAKYMDIALVECSGVLFNFGSLVLVITIITQEWMYIIATIVTYLLGVLIHPK
ncbi:hypothetical protein JUNP479_3410 [Aeromonas jandaei]|uniref:hypothetical protein n=1 Tax=Aeromonas jandaei TaxID=650 RepID=UPI0019524B1A|nr:hypothetical protein [Aeromonas jandaei]BCS50630.1 hypothetical protein JUNP479_3410 [Aeromonas jandaei]